VKVLLDEMLPAGVAGLLPSHAVTTVKSAGFTGLTNGDLIRGAVAAGYEVLLTADRNMPAQQNLPASGIALVLVPGNRMADISPRAAEIQTAVQAARPGTVTRLG
jgi:hypothetical protein